MRTWIVTALVVAGTSVVYADDSAAANASATYRDLARLVHTVRTKPGRIIDAGALTEEDWAQIEASFQAVEREKARLEQSVQGSAARLAERRNQLRLHQQYCGTWQVAQDIAVVCPM